MLFLRRLRVGAGVTFETIVLVAARYKLSAVERVARRRLDGR